MQELTISEIQIIPINPQNGLVGFASAVINNQFYVGSIAIYTSPLSSRGFRVVFPTKKLSNGKHVECFYPINNVINERVSNAIIHEYVKLIENFNNIV